MTARHARRLCAVLLVCASSALTGCPAAPTKSRGPIAFDLRRVGDNAYIAARVKSKEQSNAVVILQRDLRPPFRCEVTTGLFDPKRSVPELDQAIFGVELDTPGGAFPPPQFYGISVQLFPQGASVFSGSHLTAPNPAGNTFFDGVTRVDLAIEHDGTDMSFSTRPTGAESWTAIGELDVSTQPFPVHATLGFFRGRKPAEVGFDDFRVVSNGALPGGASQREMSIEATWLAIDAQVSIAHRLDVTGVDVTALDADFADALARIDGAVQAMELLAGEGKKSVEQKSLAKLEGARKTIEKARAKAAADKSPGSVSKLLEKCSRASFAALYALRD